MTPVPVGAVGRMMTNFALFAREENSEDPSRSKYSWDVRPLVLWIILSIFSLM